jgi:hypothetical protein
MRLQTPACAMRALVASGRKLSISTTRLTIPAVSARHTLTMGYGNFVTIDPVEPAWGWSMMQASSRCRREEDSGVLELLSASREAAFPAVNVTKLTSEDIATPSLYIVDNNLIALRMMAFCERKAARTRRREEEETEGRG